MFLVEGSDTRRMAKYIYIYTRAHTGIDYSTYARGVYMRRDFNPLRIDGLQRADRPRHHARHTDPFRLPENFPRTFQRTVLRPLIYPNERMRRKSRPKSSMIFSESRAITKNNESHRRLIGDALPNFVILGKYSARLILK